VLGAAPSVVFGDYMTGANHVLPTGGLARSYSGLSPLDFVRWTTYQIIDRAPAAGGDRPERQHEPGGASAVGARGYSLRNGARHQRVSAGRFCAACRCDG